MGKTMKRKTMITLARNPEAEPEDDQGNHSDHRHRIEGVDVDICSPFKQGGTTMITPMRTPTIIERINE